jgi:diguanylate cyclase (GGDEF)-like protein
MNILIIENKPLSTSSLKETLVNWGHTVFKASNDHKMLQRLTKIKPDFILFDIIPLRQEEFENIKIIRRLNQHKSTPILFLCESSDNENLLKEIENIEGDYLPKPISNKVLALKLKTMRHISDLKKNLSTATERLNQLASIDILTGLGNRIKFDRQLKEITLNVDHDQTNIAILLLDLDNFKTINDCLGYGVGDTLLKMFADRIKIVIKKQDVIARIDGDKFAIILCEINRQEEAGKVAERLLTIVDAAYLIEDFAIHISCSIGIAFYPSSAMTSGTLMQCADSALYYAKKLGRNNIQYYTKELRVKDKYRFSLESALRNAIDKHEIHMCYQPIFFLDPIKFSGMEALMRWVHPEFGIINPEIFIPIAEEIGLIEKLGAWALEHTCKQATQWHKEGHENIKLAINISSQQFSHAKFIPLVKSLLKKIKVPSGLLEFEITESTIMGTSAMIKKTITQLSQLKIKLSLDDFGTGYSSFVNIKNMPIQTLKIDRSFIADINKKVTDTLIVEAIISLAKILKINLIAEGIETKEQLKFLIKHECQQGQGFYLSHPLTTEEMSLFLQKQSKNSAIIDH